MFLGLQWYWWLIFLAVFIILLPFKIKFLKEYGNRLQKKRWDDEE
ncbi:MAG: hypothetical protein WBK47_06010 [Acetomicrobium sp.]